MNDSFSCCCFWLASGLPEDSDGFDSEQIGKKKILFAEAKVHAYRYPQAVGGFELNACRGF